ncbi:MAG: RcnB family protein [Novosphingobium sp.]
MATKSVLKSSVSAVLAAALGVGLLPVGAQAQERPDRGGNRPERNMPAPAPQRSMPPPMATGSRPMDRPAPSAGGSASWQGRGSGGNVPSGWGGRPNWSQGQQTSPAPRPNGQTSGQVQGNVGGWNGRPGGQQGDRGGNGRPNTPPAWTGSGWNGRPNGQSGQPTGTTSGWGSSVSNGRNPTYTDPSRNPSYRPQPGQEVRNENRGNDNRTNWGKNGNRGAKGDWNRADWNRGDRNQGGGDQWRRDRDGQWSRGDDRQPGRDRDWDRDRDHNGGWNRGSGGWNRNGYGSNGWRGNYGYGNNGYGNHAWDRDGWRRDNRYNWYGWRNSHRDIFRGGYYYAPYSDYSYSRLSIGFTLGNAFFDERYWISDPYAYRLPPAYGGYRWVRYYGDVLLVDTYSGEVVDVIYDFFY